MLNQYRSMINWGDNKAGHLVDTGTYCGNKNKTPLAKLNSCDVPPHFFISGNQPACFYAAVFH